MTKDLHYDVIVLGGGAIGENVADRAVQGGLSAVVVENALVGGECSYWACMPTKALLRPGTVLHAARNVPGAGEVSSHVDVAKTLRSRDGFTSNWDDAGQVEWLHSAHIDLVRGKARISGEREVTVAAASGEETGITAEHAVAVCTGSEPSIPPIKGLTDIDYWTSADAASLQEVPGRVAVIGGGVVACEAATFLTDLGAQVDLIVRGDQVLNSMEPFVSESVTSAFKQRGITVHLSTEVTSTTSIKDADTPPGAEVARLQLTSGEELDVDRVLVATGRKPRLPQAVGLDFDRDEKGHLQLNDDRSMPSHHWLYFVGDSSGKVHTTHQGKYDAREVGDVIVSHAKGADDVPLDLLRGDHLGPPQVVFCRPEAASVGVTLAQAHEAGRDVSVYDQDLGAIAGSVLHSQDYAGQVRFIVDNGSNTLVGVTFCGDDVAEMLHAATIAVVGEVPLDQLRHAVPSYPTMSEVWLRFLEAAGY